MKTKFMIFILLLSAMGIHAQDNEQKYTIKPKGTISETVLVLRNFSSDVSIEGSTGSEIIISTKDYEGSPEKAEGLRPLTATGVENTGIGLNVEANGNEVVVSSVSREARNSEYLFRVPKAMKVKITGESFNSSDILISGMSNEIEAVTQSGDIVIENVTGPIVANTISGDIKIDFSSLNQKLPTSLNSISGDIDITLNAMEKGKFILSSVSGEIFTDLDFKLEKKEISNTKEVPNASSSKVIIRSKSPEPPKPPVYVDVDIDFDEDELRDQSKVMRVQAEAMREHAREVKELTRATIAYSFLDDVNFIVNGGVGSKINATLNGGGVDFSINTVSGDILLRKSK